jgi:hypothetical protein
MQLVGYCHPQEVTFFRAALDTLGMADVRIQPEPMLDLDHWYIVDFDKLAEVTTRVDVTETTPDAGKGE